MTSTLKYVRARTAIIALPVLLALLPAPASAFDKNSGSDAQRAACTPEVFKYCLEKDVEAIVACLKRDKRVSKECKSALRQH